VPRSEPASSSCAQPTAPLARRTEPASLIWPNGRSAGRLRYDAVVHGRMHILPSWLFTTSDDQVAARIATLFGRQPCIDRAGSEQVYRVFSGNAEIDVLLDGPHMIRLLMVRRNGSDVLRNCDGRVQRTSRACSRANARRLSKVAGDCQSGRRLRAAGTGRRPTRSGSDPWSFSAFQRDLGLRRPCDRSESGHE
jgi:hypothetical protein